MSEWGKKDIEVLIEEYQRHECLYVVKHIGYYNKKIRNAALKKVAQAVSVLRPNTTSEQITKKFTSLRSHYGVELQKVAKSSGEGTDNMYLPGVWWFDLMGFLKDHVHPRKSKTNLQLTHQETSSPTQSQMDVLSSDDQNEDSLQFDMLEFELQNENPEKPSSPYSLRRIVTPPPSTSGSTTWTVPLITEIVHVKDEAAEEGLQGDATLQPPLHTTRRRGVKRKSFVGVNTQDVLSNTQKILNKLTPGSNKKDASASLGDFIATQIELIQDKRVKMTTTHRLLNVIMEGQIEDFELQRN